LFDSDESIDQYFEFDETDEEYFDSGGQDIGDDGEDTADPAVNPLAGLGAFAQGEGNLDDDLPL
jgi:hypothetical protein